ncbi:MAG: hypothetical protein NXI18_18550 [Alphaproteobacteria bacterium]|nr:hypothetical protein [Alphaproteobacteria bacterium]
MRLAISSRFNSLSRIAAEIARDTFERMSQPGGRLGGGAALTGAGAQFAKGFFAAGSVNMSGVFGSRAKITPTGRRAAAG